MPTDSLSNFELTLPRSLLIWVGLEVVISIAWLLWHKRVPARWVALVRFVRLCAVPYLALITGEVSSMRMGFEGFDWQNSFTLGSTLVAVIAVIWVAIRVSIQETVSNAEPQSAKYAGFELSNWSERGLAFVLCGGLEMNWSFWRANFIYLLSLAPVKIESITYWGVAAALLMVLPDTLLVIPKATAKLTNLAILLATSVIFLFTGNFWMCWAMHVILRLTALPESRE